MSIRVFDKFPSKDWHLENVEVSLFKRVGNALFTVVMNNLLLYRYGIRVVGSDVTMSEKYSIGELRHSFNPIRRLFGFPLVFSYIWSIRRVLGESLDERVEATRRHFLDNYLSTAVRHLRYLRMTDKLIEHRCILSDGEYLVFFDITDSKPTEVPVHEPELAVELRNLAQGAESNDDDWFEVKIDDGKVFLVTIPGRQTQSERDSAKWISKKPDFKPVRFS